MTNFPWVFPVGKLAIYNKVSASDCNLDWAVKIDEHHFGKMAPPIIQMFSGKNFADKKCLCDAVEFEFREQIKVGNIHHDRRHPENEIDWLRGDKFDEFGREHR